MTKIQAVAFDDGEPKHHKGNNYWIRIPAAVLYDKKICDKAKLLYGFLGALTAQKGYCWATNHYLGNELGIRKDYVPTLLRKLEMAGYIRREEIRDPNTKEVRERRIWVFESDPLLGQSNGTSHGDNGGPLTQKNYCNRLSNTDNNSLSPQSRGERAGLAEATFEAFWASYPRGDGKQAAHKAWVQAIMDGENPDTIIEAVRRNVSFNEQWSRDGGRYIPYASKWLCQKRWTDDVPLSQSTSPSDETLEWV